MILRGHVFLPLQPWRQSSHALHFLSIKNNEYTIVTNLGRIILKNDLLRVLFLEPMGGEERMIIVIEGIGVVCWDFLRWCWVVGSILELEPEAGNNGEPLEVPSFGKIVIILMALGISVVVNILDVQINGQFQILPFPVFVDADV